MCASYDPAEIAQIVGEVAPGFTANAAVAISAEHFGRTCVLSTHPVDAVRPCILTSTLEYLGRDVEAHRWLRHRHREDHQASP